MNLEGLTEKRSKKNVMYFVNDTGDMVAKVCSKCSETKILDDFQRQADGLGGKRSDCKKCKSERNKKHREDNKEYYSDYDKIYYLMHCEKKKESSRNWYATHIEQAKVSRRIHYENNLESYAESSQRYRLNNPEKVVRNNRKWRRKRPERMALYNQSRRAKKRALPNTLTPEQYGITLDYFGNACALTGRTFDLEMEHALPIDIGHGGTTFGNCYPMASGLNQSKGSRNIFEWFEANRQRFNLEQERFDRLIDWLGKANGMTVEEYRDYVYECHANINEINNAEAN